MVKKSLNCDDSQASFEAYFLLDNFIKEFMDIYVTWTLEGINHQEVRLNYINRVLCLCIKI